MQGCGAVVEGRVRGRESPNEIVQPYDDRDRNVHHQTDPEYHECALPSEEESARYDHMDDDHEPAHGEAQPPVLHEESPGQTRAVGERAQDAGDSGPRAPLLGRELRDTRNEIGERELESDEPDPDLLDLWVGPRDEADQERQEDEKGHLIRSIQSERLAVVEGDVRKYE